jgi:Fur family ferric uptake transcriptional regulator
MFGRHHHDHMICLTCGRLIEFESREIERLQEEICRRKGFTMTGHMHQIRGLCGGCSERAAGRGAAPARRTAGATRRAAVRGRER